MADWEELKGVERFKLGGRPGTYVIFDHRGKPKYVGSSDRVWDRIGGKHVSGDTGHAVQRAYELAIPDKRRRTEFIRRFITVSYLEFASFEEAKRQEESLIKKYHPAWNVDGIPGKSTSSEGVREPYDKEFMSEYV